MLFRSVSVGGVLYTMAYVGGVVVLGERDDGVLPLLGGPPAQHSLAVSEIGRVEGIVQYQD